MKECDWTFCKNNYPDQNAANFIFNLFENTKVKNVAAATPINIVTTTRPKPLIVQQHEQQKLHAVFPIENKSEKSTEQEKNAQEQKKMIKGIVHLFSRFYRWFIKARTTRLKYIFNQWKQFFIVSPIYFVWIIKYILKKKAKLYSRTFN